MFRIISKKKTKKKQKQKLIQLFARLFVYSHKNNMKMFWYYSHSILISLLRSKKDRWNICYIWRQFIKNEWKEQSSM